MKLEIHTFDPELIGTLMGREVVDEGGILELGTDARLTYVRTFTGRVKHFPLILHFEVEVLSPDGPCRVADWLFGLADKRNVEKVLVEYQDVKMSAEQMSYLLGCKE